MYVLSLANQKGGTGKSTAAINISEGLGRRGFRVLLGDLDEGQESSADWADVNEKRSFVVKLVNPLKIANFIARNENDYDYIVLDCPPSADRTAAHVVRHSDLVLIPNAPSLIEIWGLRRFIDIIKDRQVLTDGLPHARILLSRCKKRTRLVPRIVKVLKKLDMQVLDHGTLETEVYKLVIGHGETVYSNQKDFGEPIDTAACVEQVEGIVNDILEILDK